MKLVLKIFNFVIMGLSALAFVLLFAVPAFSFNSNIGLDINKFADFVPKTEYTQNYNVAELLGTDTIHVGIKFELSASDINKTMSRDKEKINDLIVVENSKEILGILHEPVDLISEFSIRETLKSTIKTEITKQVNDAKKSYVVSSAEEIMEEVGINDEYFSNFALSLYDATNKEGATVTSVSQVLYEQIDVALAKAEEGGNIDASAFSTEQKDTIKNNMLSILNSLEMVNEDSSLKKISDLPYMYLSKFVRNQLDGKVEASKLTQRDGETLPNYADRLLETFILTEMPDAFYNIVGYVSLGIFIGMFVFAGTWLTLFGFTLYRTFFSKKKYTKFGFWFYISGVLQLALGIVLTSVCKFTVSKKLDFSGLKLPLKSVAFVPRTCCLATSIVFIVMFVISIAYFIVRKLTPKEE